MLPAFPGMGVHCNPAGPAEKAIGWPKPHRPYLCSYGITRHTGLRPRALVSNRRMAAAASNGSPARKLKRKQVQLIANGDLRLSANQVCWPAQKAMEEQLTHAVAAAGFELVRAHAYKEDQKHGFIQSQKEGMDVFRAGVDPDAPIIVAEAVW